MPVRPPQQSRNLTNPNAPITMLDYLFDSFHRQTFVDWSGQLRQSDCSRRAHLPSSKAWSIKTKSLQTALCTRVRPLAEKHRQNHIAPCTDAKTAQFGNRQFELDGVTFPAAEVQIEF